MKIWMKILTGALKHRTEDPGELVEICNDLHLGFAGIHPYADGNGRMARLLGNLPMLVNGQPPLLIQLENRKQYIELLGDYTLARGAVFPSESFLRDCDEREALITFFKNEWAGTQRLVQDFRKRQKERGSSSG